MHRKWLTPLALISMLLGVTERATSQGLPPGQIYDPCIGCSDWQWSTDIVYVPEKDEYFIAYFGEDPNPFGYAALGRMDIDGNWLGHVLISPNVGATSVDLAYNTNSPGFFYVWRVDGSNFVFGAHLDGDGNLIPGTIRTLGVGAGAYVEFSPESGDYLVIWNTLDFRTSYAHVDGDPTNPDPVTVTFQEGGLAYASRLAYGGGNFLAVFQKDSNDKSNIWGRFVNPFTGAAGLLFPIYQSNFNDQNVRVAYHSGVNRFIVTFSTWQFNPPQSQGRVVHPTTGAVTNSFPVAGAFGVYEIAGDLVYNPSSDTMLIGWFHGAGGAGDDMRVQEWILSDTENTKVGGPLELRSVFGAVRSAGARPHNESPQAVFLYSEDIGFSGIWGGIVELEPPPPDETAPAAVVLGGAEGPGADEVTVTWMAPGDDGTEGRADSYEMKYSLTAPFDFGTAMPVALAPPQNAGASESVVIGGIPAETKVYVALQTSDEVPNVSPLSNVAELHTPGVAPAAVNDLEVSTPTADTAVLTWTATGDDGFEGTATSYDARYATFVINDANFDAATQLVGEPAPQAQGMGETFLATGLPPEATVYFSLKVVDEAGIASPENTGTDPSVMTSDFAGPAMTTNLTAQPAVLLPTLLPATGIASSSGSNVGDATDGNTASYWSTLPNPTMEPEWITVDLNSSGIDVPVGRVRLHSRQDSGAFFPEDLLVQVSSDNNQFTTVHTEIGLSSETGVWHELDFTPMLAQYVRIYITKTRFDGGSYWAQIAEIEVFSAPDASGKYTLNWAAPGDNGGQGTATAYDLKWSSQMITPQNFAQAEDVDPSEIPTPQVANSLETTTVTGLPATGTVYFALTARDEVPNVSPVSNVASVVNSPIPMDDCVENETITGTAVYLAQNSITSGPLTVSPPGDVTFRAGVMISLRNGFSVEAGAKFAAEIDPSLAP